MSGYTKLFNSIITSTIWQEKKHVRVVWITMLAMSDAEGNVDGSVPGLANVARVTLEECKDALERLKAPDPYSRTITNSGSRIQDIDGGWHIINRVKYRDTQPNKRYGSAEDRDGKIYFILCDTQIKIGFSKNPWSRFASLRSGMSIDPVMLGHYNGTMRDELNLHKQFKDYRVNREWYRDCPEIRRHIDTNCGSGNVATGSEKVVGGSATESLPNSYNKKEEKTKSEEKTKTSNSSNSLPRASILDSSMTSDVDALRNKKFTDEEIGDAINKFKRATRLVKSAASGKQQANDFDLLAKASLLAVGRFGDEWLADAIEAVRKRKDKKKPDCAYLRGVLASKLNCTQPAFNQLLVLVIIPKDFFELAKGYDETR